MDKKRIGYVLIVGVSVACMFIGCATKIRSLSAADKAILEAEVAFAEAQVAIEAPKPTPKPDDGRGSVKAETPMKAAQDNKPLTKYVMYFTAKWCGACQQNNPTIAKAAADPQWNVGTSSTDHIRVYDYDLNQGLAQTYSVRSLPTWLLIENGKEKKRRVGYMSANDVALFYNN